MISALILSLLIHPGAHAVETACATTAPQLKTLLDSEMKEKWIETTADDGKPLKIEISSRNDALYFVFDKTREGIWAEGKAEVCKENSDLILRVSGKDIKLGPKAPFPIRWSMGGGAKLKLKFNGAENLHVSTFGWSGDFIPGSELPDPQKESGSPKAATQTKTSK